MTLLFIVLVCYRLVVERERALEKQDPLSTMDWVEQLNVGQGDSTLLGRGRRVGLIDTGSKKALQSIDWIFSFAQRQITELDFVLLTHQDEDHAGGLERLKFLMPIDCLGPECVSFPSLFVQSRNKRAQGNAQMWTFVVPLKLESLYLNFGDADRELELEAFKAFEERWPKLLERSNRILKISHHGSRFSSSRIFLEKVRPSVAWISSGFGNSYGHPTYEVLSRLADLKIPVLRTDQGGELKADFSRP